ncbi:hypothetical protein EVAR_54976_1 [Eumeta japonica]|uniref:Uncharacterized protein n=1 Tax=Eumeta variegata TaxID=151549 RepID=A0A4C1Z0H1_EUMVA|nr:hypothetical protein EVAR_54976_1 [Eumeta japonica]
MGQVDDWEGRDPSRESRRSRGTDTSAPDRPAGSCGRRSADNSHRRPPSVREKTTKFKLDPLSMFRTHKAQRQDKFGITSTGVPGLWKYSNKGRARRRAIEIEKEKWRRKIKYKRVGERDMDWEIEREGKCERGDGDEEEDGSKSRSG